MTKRNTVYCFARGETVGIVWLRFSWAKAMGNVAHEEQTNGMRRNMKNNVLEAPWDCNARTGHNLLKWIEHARVDPLWKKALSAVYKQTWRERKPLIAQRNIPTDVEEIMLEVGGRGYGRKTA